MITGLKTALFDRRQTWLALIACTALALSPEAAEAAEVGDDGLHKQPWFSTTFKDVREDMADAADEGKRLLLIVEQRGCIYCQKMHEETFSDPEVAKTISENFMVVQYNMYGDEEVVDLDGETLTEKEAARKWRLLFTPTMVFLPEEAGEDVTAVDAAVAVMPGAFGKYTTIDMLDWVRNKVYETGEEFQRYHGRRLEERRAAGEL